jgi:hypothetical protein
MPATISAGRTISVRDRTTLVSGTSGAYAVNAAAAPTYSFVKYGTTSPVPVNSTFTMAKAYAVPAETVASGYVTVAMTAGGTVGSRPASCLHGWSNSPTVPPSQTITAAQNDGTGGASGQNNGYVPFTFNGTAYPIIAYIWQATIGTMPWYLWFKTSDGYEVCANPAAPLNITRTA